MTDKEKVLKVWPKDICESRGFGWFVVGYWHENIFLRHGEGPTDQAAWQNAAESLPANTEQHEFIDCIREECKDDPVHCDLQSCGAPRNHPSHFGYIPPECGNILPQCDGSPFASCTLPKGHEGLHGANENWKFSESIPIASTNSPAIPAKEDKCGATFDNMPWRICELHKGHDSMHHYDGIYWVFDARKQEAKECKCPTSQWVGSEPNDSTCTLSEEEHQALEIEVDKPTNEREQRVETLLLGFRPNRVENHATHLIKYRSLDGQTLIIEPKQPSDQPTQKEAPPGLKLLAEVMHLWVDGYISKSPDSLAPNAISASKFAEIERFLGSQGISVDYCGWNAALSHKEKL